MHHFKKQPLRKRFNAKTMSNWYVFRCDRCDSEIEYEESWSESDVNAKVAEMKTFFCVTIDKAATVN